jgi:D-lactate dehydrogenase (cytochrome)
LASNEEEYRRCMHGCFDIAQKIVNIGGTVSAEHGIGET